MFSLNSVTSGTFDFDGANLFYALLFILCKPDFNQTEPTNVLDISCLSYLLLFE